MLHLEFYFTRAGGGSGHVESTGSKHEEDHRDTHGHKGDKVCGLSPPLSLPSHSCDTPCGTRVAVTGDSIPFFIARNA